MRQVLSFTAPRAFKSHPNLKFQFSRKLPSLRLLKGYGRSKLQHVDWKATNLKKSNVHVLQMGGGCGPQPHPALPFRNASSMLSNPIRFGARLHMLISPHPHPFYFVMQAQCHTTLSKKLRVLVFVHFFYMGRLRTPQPPPLFRNASATRSKSIKGVQEARCTDFCINVLQMNHIVSTM